MLQGSKTTALLNIITEKNSDLDQSRSYAASLEQKVRDAEVAKDAAETMFLEADERALVALGYIKGLQTNVAEAIGVLEPLKPEPEVKAESASPLSSSQEQSNVFAHVDSGTGTAQGQSEPGPTVSDVHPSPFTPASTTTSVPETTSVSIEPSNEPSWATPTQAEPKPQPYADIRYHDYPKYVSLHDWLDGGGTEQNYYY